MTEADLSFRAAAEECRSRAAKTPNQIEKEELHRIADQWLKLAQAAGVRDVSARITRLKAASRSLLRDYECEKSATHSSATGAIHSAKTKTPNSHSRHMT